MRLTRAGVWLPLAWAIAAGAAAGAMLLCSPHAALAHGNLDQYLEGDPGCSTFNFAASVTASGGMRQEFVPRGDLLSSVGVCVSADAPARMTVVVRSGTASSPGGAIAALEIDAPVGSPAFAHADFLQGIAVTAGSSYVIEVQSAADITWYGNPPGGFYPYAPGISNACPEVESFAFLSYLVAGPTAGQSSQEKECGAAPAPTSTPQPTATRTASPTASPTGTRTITPTATPTLAPGETATLATPTLPPAVATATPPGPPPASPVGGVATPTPARTAIGSVLGTAPLYATRAFLPDVGSGGEASGQRRADVLLLAGSACLAAALALRIRAASRR